MDFSKATNQQLYEIVRDEEARMRDRYAAAYELQRRRRKQEFEKVNIESEENRWF